MNEMNQLSVSSALDTSHLDVKFPFKAKYGNFINGQWEAPKSGQYFDNTSPITGEVICQVARSNEEDINLAPIQPEAGRSLRRPTAGCLRASSRDRCLLQDQPP